MESRYFNDLLNYIAQEERYNTELTLAKQEFEGFAGTIHEGDRSFEARINAFHNWYILDRELQGRGITPLRYFLEYNANTLPAHEQARFRELRDNLHSVFELVKFSAQRTRVRDLISGRKYDLEGVQHTQFLDRGALFNTRIFRHESAYYFSNYFLLHPAEVGKLIRGEARKVKKSRQDPKRFLFLLVLYQSRYDQYHQMETRNIYRFSE